jgi:zinc and cadmium transporter
LCATHLVVNRVSGDNPNSSRRRRTSILFLIGIGFHSFLDGIIYSVTFSFDTVTGMLAAAGMILHEFPEGVLTFVLLKRGGYAHRRAMIYSLWAVAATTPAGTLISLPMIRRVAVPELGALLALAAGALLYVGASHLLPDVEAERRSIVYLALAAGVMLAVGGRVLGID